MSVVCRTGAGAATGDKSGSCGFDRTPLSPLHHQYVFVLVWLMNVCTKSKPLEASSYIIQYRV